MATDTPPLAGLLNLDKPPAMTSRDVVNRVVAALRQRFPKPAKLPKAGHAGTLDPMATGVLLVGVGAGVRLVPYLHQQPKVYEATFRLGQSSVSGDLETPLVDQVDPPRPSLDALQAAALRLTGSITQTPPAHSAVKIAGRRAYEFAHRGLQVEVPSRVVQIEQLTIERYAYPEIDLTIRCGTGTYIRTLGMDLAALCATTAVMTKLVRTRIGDFPLSQAVSLEQLDGAALEQHLHPLAPAVAHLPQLVLEPSDIERVINGIKLNAVALGGSAAGGSAAVAGQEAAVLDQAGKLRAIVRRRGDQWCPYRVLPG